MGEASHILHVSHGHHEDADCADYWVTEKQAAAFLGQLKSPQGPFVLFQDEDGIHRAYTMADIRFVEVRKVAPVSDDPEAMDQPRPEAKVISIMDFARGITK